MVIVKMPDRYKPFFSRYIGIDYSGAETPGSSLKTAGRSLRESGAGGGLSVAVEQEFFSAGAHARPARRLCRRRLAEAARL